MARLGLRSSHRLRLAVGPIVATPTGPVGTLPALAGVHDRALCDPSFLCRYMGGGDSRLGTFSDGANCACSG